LPSLWKTVWPFLIILKYAIFIWSNNFTASYLSTRIKKCISKNIWTQTLTDAFIITKKWKQCKYSPADKWMKKMCHTVQYFGY
jgi:hypothetical protein